jgi:hypothetical protein
VEGVWSALKKILIISIIMDIVTFTRNHYWVEGK